MVVDGSDNIYAADFGGLIWKVTTAGVATIITGSASQGYKDGGRNAQFNTPIYLGRDSKGNLYVTDIYNSVVRKIVLR